MNDKKILSVAELIKKQYNNAVTLRPIDDLCGSEFFRNINCTEMLLSNILGNPSMKLEKIATQEDFPNLFGRGGRLDIVAFDSLKGIYDLEFQRNKEGSGLDRALFNYALLARYTVPKGTDFKDFPYTGVLFVQEDDFFHVDQAVTKVKFILDSNPPLILQSKLDIVFVNANIQDKNTLLGKMLHDLCCSSADEMLVPEFAERMRQVKNPEGKEMFHMCEALEMQWNEGLKKGEEKMARDIVSNLFANGAALELVQLSVPSMSQDEILEIRHSVEERGKGTEISH